MSDRDAFVRTIIENPDDEGPCLVYADWLEEQGDPRAEYIRLQWERTHLDDPAEKQRLTRRCDDLERLHFRKWIADLPRLDSVVWGPFERGFVRRIRVADVNAFLQAAEAVFETTPVGEVWFERVGEEGAATLAASAWLERITVFKAHAANLGDAGLRSLVGSKHAINLRQLLVTGDHISDAGANAIARSPHLSALARLFVNRNQIGDDGAVAIAQSKHLASLVEFFGAANPISDRGRQALIQRLGEANVHF